MTSLISFVLLPLAGYLVGSIPFGYLIGRRQGVDVRNLGSGNVGATNVGRVVGPRWGSLCFVLDVLKGLLPVLGVRFILMRLYPAQDQTQMPLAGQLAWLTIGAACIVGHMYSIYLGGRGGKGMATSLGVLLGIWPYFTLTSVIALAIWVAVWGFSRYVSLASIAAAVGFPLAFILLMWRLEQWRLDRLWPLFAFSCLMALLVIFRHRSNISRLLAGTEHR